MPGLDDLSDEEIMQYLKQRKGKKRYRVREYEIDGEDFARLFGLGEPSKPEPSEPAGEGGEEGGEGEGGKPRRLRLSGGGAGDKFFGTGS